MPAKRKTWKDKFVAAKPEHIVVLEKAFAGVPAGKRLLIPSPALIDAYVREVPSGSSKTIVAMREELAAEAGADATCPVTTSMFARIAAEAALEDVSRGKQLSDIAPFWRVIGPGDAIASKLSCGIEFIETQRKVEAGA